MSEKVKFEVALKDEKCIVIEFKKRDWRLIQYLVSTTRYRANKNILLSILMYPAVWSVENAIWERDYGRSFTFSNGSNAQSRFNEISKAREECYEKARAIVRDEMMRQAKIIQWHDLGDIKIKKHEFVLKDDAGFDVLSITIPKKDWESLLEICYMRRLNEGGRFLVNYLTKSVCFAVADAIWARDYHDLLESDANTDDIGAMMDLHMKELNFRSTLVKVSQKRVQHCMG